MKPSPRQSRTECKLSQSTHRCLNSYALAASAAGVGILALTLPAEAKIIYVATHHVLTKGASYKLDLNHDGKMDFTLRVKQTVNTSSSFTIVSAIPVAGNGVRGFGGQPGWASALKPGSEVGRYQYFPGQEMAGVARTGGGGTFYPGSWINVKNRYLGLKFKIAGKTHYGWARLNVQVADRSITATLTGYAYETIANKSIRTGQTKENEAVVEQLKLRGPKSPSLGLLAMGSRGLFIWRRNQATDLMQ